MNPESGYFIGVDVKKFSINIGLINFKGDMVEQKNNIPYKFENTPDALEELCKTIRDFIKKTTINTEKILNININISGRVNPESGYSFSSFNFSERPLAEVLTEKIGYSVCLDNDTRAMTYGGCMKGICNKEKDVLFVDIKARIGHQKYHQQKKCIPANRDFRESLDTLTLSITRLSAIAERKDVWKLKLRDQPCTASCCKESMQEKVPSYRNA